jgi:hypothetical protein
MLVFNTGFISTVHSAKYVVTCPFSSDTVLLQFIQTGKYFDPTPVTSQFKCFIQPVYRDRVSKPALGMNVYSRCNGLPCDYL